MWILIGAALIRRLRLLETRRLIEEIWYRVRIRSKKWWWLFFAWAVNALIANAWNLFRTVQKQKIGMLEFQRVVVMTLLAKRKNISLQSQWRFHEILLAMWSLIPKIILLWKAHKNIVAVNTVVVDESIYARNAMLPYTLSVLKTAIHKTENLFYSFLPEVLTM